MSSNAIPGPIFVDSAVADDVAAAAEHGLVSGVTTNPKLLAAAAASSPPTEADIDRVVAGLLALECGPVYHQVQAPPAMEDARWEAERIVALAPDRIVLKLPATTAHARFGRDLVDAGMTVAMTAVYSPGQYVVAASIGAQVVIPYVDRHRRLRPDEQPVVRQLRAMHDALGSGPAILAASIKTPKQAVQAMADGAAAVSVTPDVVRSLAEHDLTVSAVKDFAPHTTWS